MVLTDLQMPVLDGFELTRRLRASPRLAELPVCVFSTLSSKADRDLAAKCGADAYLVKTEMQHTDLVQTVRRFVGRERGAA